MGDDRLAKAAGRGHDADIRALIERLLELQFELGQLTAKLEFHLHVRDLSVRHPEAPGKIAVPSPAGREPLREAIPRLLAKCPLTLAELAEDLSRDKAIVRQAVLKLIKANAVVREGRTYRLAREGASERNHRAENGVQPVAASLDGERQGGRGSSH